MSVEKIRELMNHHLTAVETIRRAQDDVRGIEDKLIAHLFEYGDMHAFKINWSYLRRMIDKH